MIKKISSGIFSHLSRLTNKFTYSEKFIFWIFLILFIPSLIYSILYFHNQFTVEVPQRGGTLEEGVVGSPRFINPVLAQTDTDRDFTALIYSGLVKIMPGDEIRPDLAEKYEVSEDGLEYTFFIRQNAKFHDNTKLTADDIVFTINKIQDPELKSPKRANWEGVVVEKIDDYKIRFILKEPHENFIRYASIGILPLHIWNDQNLLFSEYNFEPIGSGPYKIEKIKKDNKKIPEVYILESFSDYTLGQPYLTKIEMHIFSSLENVLDAIKKNKIKAIHGILPKQAIELKKNNLSILKYPLPRIYGIFFNQERDNVLADKTVRQALDLSAPKSQIVNDILHGFAKVSVRPIPFEIGYTSEIQTDESENIEKARKILIDDGWEMGEDGILIKKGKNQNTRLSFSITTGSVPELLEVGRKIESSWKQLGAEVILKVYEQSDLNNSIIKPRTYDTLLFGIVVYNPSDLYAFWHSSQRISPGLNISNYTNDDADKILVKIREEKDQEKISNLISSFNDLLKKDIPAILLYSPDFIYIVPENLKGPIQKIISFPSDRFSNVFEWHFSTKRIWKIFN